MDVAKGLLCFRWSFSILDVCKLFIHQVKVDGIYGLLNAPLVHLQHLGIRIGRWSFLRSVYNIPKIHESQQHFDFELPKIEVPSIELVNDSSNLPRK